MPPWRSSPHFVQKPRWSQHVYMAKMESCFAEYERQARFHDCPTQSRYLAAGSARGYTTVVETVERHGALAGTLYLKSDFREIEQRWRHLLEVACGLLVLALLVGGLSGSVLRRRISRPVRELAGAMHEVTTRENFAARVRLLGSDEIAQLGSGFNSMLSELEKRALEKSEFEAQLRFQALNDALTGLPNR